MLKVTRIALLAIALMCCLPLARAADADLQQYNRVAAAVETVCGSNPLTSSLLLVVDGKRITADNNAVGKAPINRSVKQLADYATCVRCMTIGDCAGVNLRTLRAVQVDGTGGAVASASAGTIVASAARGGTTLPTTPSPHGVTTADSPVLGFCSYSYFGSYSFVGGYNCDSISTVATGTVQIKLGSAPSNYLKCSAVGGGFFNSGATYVSEASASAPVAGKLPVTVHIRNMSGAAADGGFSVIVFCGA